MIENQQPFDKQDKNTDEFITTGQPYARSVETSRGASLSTEENRPTIMSVKGTESSVNDAVKGTEVAAKDTSGVNAQAGSPPADKGMNPGLTRALMGGLIGATLGTLVGALANKRTSEGVNHAAKGVGVAVKSVTEGVSHAAKGVGVAVKSVTEGVSHAVIGGTVEAVKDTAEGAKQSVSGAVEAVKDTAEGAKQTVTGAADAIKDATEDAKRSDNQGFKLAQERQVAANEKVTTGSVGIGDRAELLLGEVPLIVEEEGVVVAIGIPVDPEMPEYPSEPDFR